ncbi:MAG: hypothetical protein EPN70_16155 [Paraburkholderia sp.]|nr:MAG: hypothetical protein EPN70_16155 [Paraburkholderia sp.]
MGRRDYGVTSRMTGVTNVTNVKAISACIRRCASNGPTNKLLENCSRRSTVAAESWLPHGALVMNSRDYFRQRIQSVDDAWPLKSATHADQEDQDG